MAPSGCGLKQIILDCYGFIVDDYDPRRRNLFVWISRGSYAARALAGLIGASGIQRDSHPGALLDAAWRHYRVKPSSREQPPVGSLSEQKAVANYAHRATAFISRKRALSLRRRVGYCRILRYPRWHRLAALARYYALITLGFHDTGLGTNVAVGLHALAVDEHRRPFVPTFWTIAKGQKPKGNVEQTWFAGAHCNVGGGYPDSGLSDQALIWMIARVQALTGLEFNVEAVGSAVHPNVDGSIVDSTAGWPIDHAFPHYRKVLPANAVRYGYLLNTSDPTEERINETVH